MSDDQLRVTLPTNGARKHELLHELAWINLLSPHVDELGRDGMIDLDLDIAVEELFADMAVEEVALPQPDEALAALLRGVLDQAGVGQQSSRTAIELAQSAVITTEGWCGSDLFIQCSACDGDRVVLEIKGPTAYVNYSRSKRIYQTQKYRQTYEKDTSLACNCEQLALRGTPYFVLLDARSRSRGEVQAKECIPDAALQGWIWLSYRDVLTVEPFTHNAVAQWLLGP